MMRDTTDDTFDLSDFLPYLLNQAAEASGQDFQTRQAPSRPFLRVPE